MMEGEKKEGPSARTPPGGPPEATQESQYSRLRLFTESLDGKYL